MHVPIIIPASVALYGQIKEVIYSMHRIYNLLGSDITEANSSVDAVAQTASSKSNAAAALMAGCAVNESNETWTASVNG